MTDNQAFVRSLAGVFLGITVLTGVTMVLAMRHPPPVLSADEAASAEKIAKMPPAKRLGAELYEKKGCIACHSVDGTERVGPTFWGDYGETIALSDGSMVTVDEAYIRESLISPQAKARPGYPPTMPTFANALTPRETDALIAYLRSLNER